MVKIAIVGATGLVGRTMIQILQEENITADYILFNSKNLTRAAVKKFKPDYALFAVSAELSKVWTPFFVGQGCTVIDNSSAYRTDPDIPLVVPECNIEIIKRCQDTDKKGRIVANPNCSTIGALLALKPLDDAFKIRRVIYSTYQAISGAGANPTFAYPIENNLIPFISGEEEKMVHETRKILGRNDIAVSATCVRVPVANCHSISINVEFKKRVNIECAKEILRIAPGVMYMEDELPMPIIADGTNPVYVGRVRVDESRQNTINLFTVSDNVRKGAALNAVQILKCLMR